MVAKGERALKVLSSAGSKSSSGQKLSATLRSESFNGSQTSSSILLSFDNQFKPDEASMTDEACLQDKHQVDPSTLAGIKPRGEKGPRANSAKLNPRPIQNQHNVRFISPTASDVRTISFQSSFGNEGDGTPYDEDDDGSFDSYGIYSFDSMWSDEVDPKCFGACAPINSDLISQYVGPSKLFSNCKTAPQDVTFEMPALTCKTPSPHSSSGVASALKSSISSHSRKFAEETMRGEGCTIQSVQSKAGNVKELIKSPCTLKNEKAEEDFSDVVLDVKQTAVFRHSVIEEFEKRSFTERRDAQPSPRECSLAEFTVPPVLSADGQVIHQYVADIAHIKNETPAQKWTVLSDRLLRHPEEAFLKDDQGRTALSYACQYANDIPTVVLRDILECCPEAAATPDKNGRNPLHYYVSSNEGGAVWKRNKETALLLIEKDATVAMQDEAGNTPLLSAVETYARLQSKSDADLRLPLINALIEAHPQAVKIPNKQKSYPLHFAAKGFHAEVITSLLQHFPSAANAKNCFGATPLFLAVYWRAPIDAMKELLSAKPEAAMVRVDSIGDDPISLIYHSLIYPSSDDETEKERVSRSRLCLDRANSVKELPIDIRGEWLILELLAKAAYHKNTFASLLDTAWRPLHALCGLDVLPELVRFAIRFHREDLYDRDEMGRLPIHIAAATYIKQPNEREAKHSLLWYLSHEDPVTAKIEDLVGRLPIHYAAEMRRSWEKGGMKYLVSAHPRSLSKRDGKTGLYPFMLAAMRKPTEELDSPHEHLDLIYHLIRSEPDVLSAEPRSPNQKPAVVADEDEIEVSHEDFAAVRTSPREEEEEEEVNSSHCTPDSDSGADSRDAENGPFMSYNNDEGYSEVSSTASSVASTGEKEPESAANTHSITSKLAFSEVGTDVVLRATSNAASESKSSRMTFSAKGDDVFSVDNCSKASSLTCGSRLRSDKSMASKSERIRAVYAGQPMPGDRLTVQKGLKSRSRRNRKNSQEKQSKFLPSLSSHSEVTVPDSDSTRSAWMGSSNKKMLSSKDMSRRGKVTSGSASTQSFLQRQLASSNTPSRRNVPPQSLSNKRTANNRTKQTK